MESELRQTIKKRALLPARFGYYVSASFLVVVDYFAVAAAAGSAIFLRDAVMDYTGSASALLIPELYAYGIVPCVFLCFIAYAELYTRRLPLWNCAELLFKICLYVNLLIVILTYFLGKAESISRLYMILFWALSFLYLCAFRYIIKRALIRLGIWQIPVVIVGAGKTAELLARTFQENPTMGYEIEGLIEDCRENRPLLKQFPHIGNFEDIERVLKDGCARDVILATPGLSRERLIRLLYRIQPHARKVAIIPDIFGVPLGNIKAETIFDQQILLLRIKNNLDSYANKAMKRTFDLIAGVILLIGIIPMTLAIAIWIKSDTKGPILHIAERIGKSGKLFYCYKFRTMHTNADEILEKFLKENPGYKEEWERYAKLRGKDPRVTRSGKWLRKYSLDELPQILNVLIGNMSLVGPRPYLPREKEKMKKSIDTILLTVPGITGLWQVSGRNEIDFNGRLQLDSWYVRNWSMWQDIVILIKTVKVVLGRDGAY